MIGSGDLKLRTESDQHVQHLFERLASGWREETGLLSSITDIAMHPDYQRIIGLGEKALPLILRELGQQPDHWFWALKAITGEDPVPPEAQGDMQRMRKAWLEWGESRGFSC
jgi:hypothetical protein